METVIELSIEDTNSLRSKLGLKPLRVSGAPSRTSPKDPAVPALDGVKEAGGKEELSLSVGETNALRERLGLKPLRNGGG